MFLNLENELRKHHLTKRAYAKFLNISNKTLFNKMNGITDFTLKEMKRSINFISSETPLTIDYLFEWQNEL